VGPRGSFTTQWSRDVRSIRRILSPGDGALVVRPPRADQFEELRRRNLLQRPRMIAEAAARRPAVLVVFDVMQIGRDDLSERLQFERRHALHAHIPTVPGAQIIERAETQRAALFRAIVDGDHESLVAPDGEPLPSAGRDTTRDVRESHLADPVTQAHYDPNH